MCQIKKSIYKPGYEQYIDQFDSLKGFDYASFFLNKNVTYYGIFEISPVNERLSNRLIGKTSFIESEKPYKAHWMIYNSELLLGYVNGLSNGEQLFTTDLLPEFPNDELLFHYQAFSGTVKFIVKLVEIGLTEKEYRDYDFILMRFESGILIGVSFKQN